MKVFSRDELRRRRTAAELSARALSISAGFGYNTVAAIESGQIDSPTTQTLQRLAEKLACEATDFYIEEPTEAADVG